MKYNLFCLSRIKSLLTTHGSQLTKRVSTFRRLGVLTFRRLVFSLLMLPLVAMAAKNTEITSVKLFNKPSYYSLFIYTNNYPSYKTFTLTNPDRLVVDVSGGHLKGKVPSKQFRHTVIHDVRVGYPGHHVTRFVFDLTKATPYKSTVQMIPPHKYAINVRLQKTHAHVSSKPYHPKLGRKIIVVVDPGHGGKDPGTTGPNGTHEKNVVLSISKFLAADINKAPGFVAKLTRNADYYITLRGRLAIARKDHADMFIAIHADAFREKSATGASVFALSQHGATSEAARWLAKRENASELMGGVDLNDKSSMLKSVLISLSQTATIRTSLQIGNQVLDQLGQVTHLHHGYHVEQAAFVVLKSPDIPSLLVETGFLSNPQEEARLDKISYRKTIAKAISKGIIQYFRKHPPRGTELAINK